MRKLAHVIANMPNAALIRFAKNLELMAMVIMLHYLVVRLLNQTAFTFQFQTDADMRAVPVIVLVGLAALLTLLDI